MRRLAPLFVLVALVLLVVVPAAVRYTNYYGLGGQGSARPTPPSYSAEAVVDVVAPPQGEFVDEPTVGAGHVLLDLAHDNSFTLDEIGSLDGRLAARGYDMLLYRNGDLGRYLRGVSAYIVIAPLSDFEPEEIQVVTDFVGRGGHLLLIGDPARFGVELIEDDFGYIVDYALNSSKLPLNSLANEFDITFEGDYLYNLVENEGNFRNILVPQSQMGENSLTADLSTVALYGSHSLQVGTSATPLLMGGADTYSSATDRAGGLVLGATSMDNKVLALGDINFLTEPYYASLDNSQFIARIADFLVAGGRDYILTDFPYFFQDGQLNLAYVGDVDLGASAFGDIISLQDAFRTADLRLHLTAEPSAGDTLYVGLYNQALTDPAVLAMLEEADLTLVIDPPVLTTAELADLADKAEDEATDETDETEKPDEPDVVQQIQSAMGNVEMVGTTLLLYRETADGRDLLLLAASQEGLQNSINRLLDLMPLDSDYALADCLTAEGMALCPSDVDEEIVEAELLSTDEAPRDTPPADDEDPTDTPPDVIDEDPFTLDDLDPVPTDAGEVGLDETVEGTLAEEESAVWTYVGDSATVDISVTGDEDFDAVLELYDADGIFVEYVDSTYSGDTELLEQVDIEDGYQIVIRDFYAAGGDYSLTVETVAGGGSGQADPDEQTADASPIQTIFLYIDDRGDLADVGDIPVVDIASLLEDDYDLTVWSAAETADTLTADDLEGYDLILWYSGLYRNEDAVNNEDYAILSEAIFGGGRILIIGATPPLLEPVDLADLADLEVVGENSALLGNWEAGDVIELTAVFETAVTDQTLEDMDPETDVAFLSRGPASANSGEVVGITFNDSFLSTRLAIIVFPLEALEPDLQIELLAHLLDWFTAE